jgi:hypothetical protein
MREKEIFAGERRHQIETQRKLREKIAAEQSKALAEKDDRFAEQEQQSMLQH